MIYLARFGVAVAFGVLTTLCFAPSALAFGALAIESDSGGNVGWSHDYNTKEDAEDKAMSECGPHCSIVLDFWNTCAAYSTDQSGSSTIFGWGTGATQEAAENKAQHECVGHGGDQCAVQVWSCE